MNYRARQRALIAALEKNKLDFLLITHLPNIRYLCGFTGSAGALLVGQDGCAFFTDGRYAQQAREQISGLQIVIERKSPLEIAARWLCGNFRRKCVIGFEAQHMAVAERSGAKGKLAQRFQLRSTVGLVEKLRQVKDAEEVSLLRAAVRLGSSLFEPTIRKLRPGTPETVVAAHLEFKAREAGAEGMSFPTIVAAGARSALPHGQASAALVPVRGFVVLDFGVILAGYCSDMTRTVFLGRPSREERLWYESVWEAQSAAIEVVRAGVETTTVDEVARKILKKSHLDKFFTHSTGHGVGIEIHEAPYIGARSSTVLQPGMVITIEPGVYIPKRGGVRIEDMAVVTDSGCEVLTPTPKQLITV